MYTNKKLREHISALMDGESPDADQELALAALQETDGKAAWELYHLIGDHLRTAAVPDLSPDFRARLVARLAAEPAPLRPALDAAEPDGVAAVLANPAAP